MKLRGIDFGNVLGAAGVQGFFGEGYWFHRLLEFWGQNLDGITFVSKTATLLPRKGNMKLTSRYTPARLMPSCIRAKPWRSTMLNAIDLSNPGLETLINCGRWQERKRPFWISFAPTGALTRERLDEFRAMRDVLGEHMDEFQTPFGLQLNLSCPNSGHPPEEIIGESASVLDIMGELGLPLMPKYSIASAPIPAIMELNSHPRCDAICVSNTIKFGWEGIDWKKAWGSTRSPLAELGGGGLSGKTLLPLVCEYIERLRDAGFTKPINGGGGILSPWDVVRYHAAGASSIFIGTAIVFASLFPFRWNIPALVVRANKLDWN